VSVCYFHFSYYRAVNDPPCSVCIRSRSHRSKESQRSHRHRSHHRPRHRSRTKSRSRSRSRSRSASASDRHKRSRRSSHHRSVSTTHEQSPPAETPNKSRVTSHHHKKKKDKKDKKKSSKSHQRHLTPTSTDTSPSVEEPLSERRLVILGTVKQQQVHNDICDNHDSESSNEGRCLDEGGSNSWQHSPLRHNFLTVKNKESYSKHNDI